MTVKIIDNFISDFCADILENQLLGHQPWAGSFPWYYHNDLNGKKKIGNFYFNHTMVDDGKQYSDLLDIHPILALIGLSPDRCTRIKANLYPRTQWRVYHQEHDDYPPKLGFQTALYYVNTCNRVTKIGNKKIKSVKNRLVVFDGSIPHQSSTPTNVNAGCSINIIYPKKNSYGKF